MASLPDGGGAAAACLPLPAYRILRWLVVASYLLLAYLMLNEIEGRVADNALWTVVILGVVAAEITVRLSGGSGPGIRLVSTFRGLRARWPGRLGPTVT